MTGKKLVNGAVYEIIAGCTMEGSRDTLFLSFPNPAMPVQVLLDDVYFEDRASSFLQTLLVDKSGRPIANYSGGGRMHRLGRFFVKPNTHTIRPELEAMVPAGAAYPHGQPALALLGTEAGRRVVEALSEIAGQTTFGQNLGDSMLTRWREQVMLGSQLLGALSPQDRPAMAGLQDRR